VRTIMPQLDRWLE